MKERLTIFFSWQSEVKQRNFIRDCMRKAKKEVEKKNPQIEIILDEDARGGMGSLDIAEEIERKITEADIFIADITFVGNSKDGSQIPNANVMTELGQASMFLGWGRIVMLLNSNIGKPDDAPFDIRKRTIISFTTDKPDGEMKLISFFTMVFEGIAKTHKEKKWHADMKKIYNDARRIQDVQVINSILEIVSPGIMDRFIDKIPNYYTHSGIDSSDILNIFVQSFRFHLNDKELLNRVKDVQIGLDRASSHIRTVDAIPGSDLYKLSPNLAEIQFLNDAKLNLAKAYKKFIDYVRENYPEVNIP